MARIERKAGEVRWDRYGEFRAMAFADGYVMFRRPRATPYVVSVKEWDSWSRKPLHRADVLKFKPLGRVRDGVDFGD